MLHGSPDIRVSNNTVPQSDLGMSLDSKSADKDLKAVTPEKCKVCITAFTKKLVTIFQLSKTRSDHISLKSAKERNVPCYKMAKSGW